jgi:outer membrane protein OmpA-like peptidoglycan-associated protein
VRSSFWLAAAALLVPVDARAELTRNIELTVFDPMPATVGSWFHVQGTDVGRSGDLVISSWVSHAYDALVLDSVQSDDSVVRHRTMFVVGGAYALGDRVELGARMPVYKQSGEPALEGIIPAARGTSLGDLAVHGRVRLWRNNAWGVGLGLTLKLPTATDSEFAGTEMPSGRGSLLVSYTASNLLSFVVNAGAVVRKRVEFANIEQGSGVAWGFGAAYRMAEKVIVEFEAFGDVVPNGRVDDMKAKTTQLTFEGLLGVRMHATPQLSIGIAGGRGLTRGLGEPALRGVLTLAYAPSGRPLPPLRTPAVVVPIDPTTHDTDFDKLVDAADKCPNEREDKDGFQDEDGCPDLDNDGDKVPDDKDKCAAAAEDHDEFQDTDGCPEEDNDNDGVADAQDACPVEPEKINGVDDTDGCPDKGGDALVISTPDRLELLESVAFTGTTVAKTSANVLGQLVTTLRARTDIIRLRIGVHVQPTNNPKRDQALSDRRAAAVRDWLSEHGIVHERIDPKGFGGTKPLVPASQKGAAAINDRVELIILERH